MSSSASHPAGERQRYLGRIAGVGSSAGVRVVLGHWHTTPMGAFSDAMVERPDGHRILLAPSAEVAEFIEATYVFDETRVEPITIETTDAVAGRWHVRSPSLTLDLVIGGPTWLGRLLGLVPRRLAIAPSWCALTDQVARRVLRGVRTRGETRGTHGTSRRREWYGATGNRAVVALSGAFEGSDVGSLARVEPAPRFGFSSTPARPSVTDVVTTVEIGGSTR